MLKKRWGKVKGEGVEFDAKKERREEGMELKSGKKYIDIGFLSWILKQTHTLSHIYTQTHSHKYTHTPKYMANIVKKIIQKRHKKNTYQLYWFLFN